MADIWNELTDSFNKEMAIDEMKKKYEGTYLILIKEDGSEEVVRYLGYDGDYHNFKDSLNISLRVKHETKCQIVCSFPERRLFNTRKVALEFVRMPTRQYKRGINKENCHIYSPIRKIWSGDGHPWDHNLIKEALYPWYPADCKHAISLLEKGEVASIALDERFMLSLSIVKKDKKSFHLWYSNCIIGQYENETFTVKHKLFTQEVMDNLKLFQPYRVEF